MAFGCELFSFLLDSFPRDAIGDFWIGTLIISRSGPSSMYSSGFVCFCAELSVLDDRLTKCQVLIVFYCIIDFCVLLGSASITWTSSSLFSALMMSSKQGLETLDSFWTFTSINVFV